jgi:protein-disulfide isomerase
MKGFSATMKTALRMLTMALLLFAVSGMAQAGDTSVLHPPRGSRLAIIVFEDLECPQCGRVEPLLQDAVRNYKIPLVRYDFPLPMHPWAFDAHVFARYFDTKSKQLGEEFRGWIFANQNSVTKQNLRGMTERFASEHHVSLPAFVDSSGQLAAKVKEDQAIGTKVGIDHTPTIYVVSTSPNAPYVEVKEPTQLFAVIEQVKTQLPSAAAATPASKGAAKGTRKSVQ